MSHKESSVSVESGYASQSDLKRAQHHRSNEETTSVDHISGSNEISHVEETKDGMDKHPKCLHSVKEDESVSEEDKQISRLERMEQKLEDIAKIKREMSSIRTDCGDPRGYIEKFEQQLSEFMVSLDLFTKRQQEQSKHALNSRSHTETVKLPHEQVSNKVILGLSSPILRSWKFIGRALDLDESDIEGIEMDSPNNHREQSYQMLLLWKQRHPENANYQVLGEVLRKEDPNVYLKYLEIVSSHLRL